MISRGDKGLAERYRPQRFSEMLGQEKMLAGIRQRWSRIPRPTCMMFSGDTGNGKTTLARIIAVSLNCAHQEKFGEPCKDCRQKKSEFGIVEDALRKTKDLEQVIADYKYTPFPPALYRVYIIDEAQGLSKASQETLLKPTESGPINTIWLFCTTSPQGIIKPLRNRCVHFQIPMLKLDDCKLLVHSVIEKEIEKGLAKQPESKLVEKFIDNLNEQSVFGPRLILQNLEKFLVTQDPNCVVGVSQEESVMLARYVLNGDWAGVRARCVDLDPQQLEGVRRGIIAYMRKVLLDSKRSQYASNLAASIQSLASASSYDDSMTAALTISALYLACKRFERN